jgi:hypothetical protein
MSGDLTKAARELLAFYIEAGVDVCLGDAPADHVAGGSPSPSPHPYPARPHRPLRPRPWLRMRP